MGKRDLLSTLSTLDKGPGKHVYPCVPCVGAPEVIYGMLIAQIVDVVTRYALHNSRVGLTLKGSAMYNLELSCGYVIWASASRAGPLPANHIFEQFSDYSLEVGRQRRAC